MGRSAVFSPWGLYRYVLWRHWQRDDATTRRCIRFAQDWGYGGLCLTNLFAFRARHPATLLAAEKPVGPENAAWLRACAASSATVVAAWGRQGTQAGRDCQATAPRWLFCRRCRCCASAKPPNPCTLFTCRKPQTYCLESVLIQIVAAAIQRSQPALLHQQHQQN